MKYNIQKFAQIVGKVGADLQEQSQTISETSQGIDASTDVKIFIESNKSSNLVVSREKFKDYEDGMEMLGSSKVKKETQDMTFIIQDNYMTDAVGATHQEETKQNQRIRSENTQTQILQVLDQ